MTEEAKTDANKIDWNKRFRDPAMMAKWKAEIQVIPANREKGEHNGTRILPDGSRENFYVA